MMKYLSLFFCLCCLIACNTTPKPAEKTTEEVFCDCRELHYNPTYNVFHQGDPKNGFTGLCKDFYKGGFLKKEIEFVKGKYHGKYKFYFKSGALKSVVDYEVGLVTGDQKLFNESGELLYHGIYKRNQLVKNVFPEVVQDSLKQ